MPLYKTITPNSQTTVKIWKITESYEDLMVKVNLKPIALERVLGMKSEMHQRGFLSVRHLLHEFGYSDSDLFYDENGKPHLKDGKQISITHSFNFSAVIVSDLVVGIDIEKQRDKILRIAYKFTPIQEYSTLANSEAVVRKLTTVWGAKESLYKIYAQPGLSFLNHINVKDFSLDDESTTAEILYEGRKSKYDVSFFEIENFTCVYALRLVEVLE